MAIQGIGEAKPKGWDPSEITYLLRAARLGLYSGEIADDLGRDEDSVRKVAFKMRMKLNLGWP